MNIQEILSEIEQAYPEDIFPDTTQGERDDVIERYPGFVDRTSAMMGRHLVKVIREKLAHPEDDGVWELIAAAENVLHYRGVIGEYPHLMIEPTERIPGWALDRLSTALQKVKQGSGEDRLYKTAQTLLDLYDQRGPDQFTALFCTLDILDVCQQIVAEGEDNPHPWPGADV